MTMAAMFSLKRAALCINSQSASRCFGAWFSTAFEQAEKRNMREVEVTGKMANVARDMAGLFVDAAREGMTKVNQNAASMGETEDTALPGAWGTAKETVEKIKDAVVGEDDEVEGPNKGDKIYDRSIEDLRKRAGGYDKKNSD